MDYLNNISPIDGRYASETGGLSKFFSEAALIKYRLMVEVEYLIALACDRRLKLPKKISKKDINTLRNIYVRFSSADAVAVKQIERTTRHDVKAIEYFLRDKLKNTSCAVLTTWVHFALTSEDINNISYSLAWRDAITKVYLPQIDKVNRKLAMLARRHAKQAMLAMTHGQPATPTTLGKEFGVYVERLNRQIKQLASLQLQAKFSGATGTWGAHVIAHPKIDWVNFSSKLINQFGLQPKLLSTQVESYDSLAEGCHAIQRINTILIDLVRDMWLYISRGIFIQSVEGRVVGSSTMPHKINPIDFENAEGNLGMANVVLGHLAATLPISRMQRDLSHSTVIRNQGAPLAHSLLAYKNVLKGLAKLKVDKNFLNGELDSHWEVLGEAIQTILRKHGQDDAYENVKKSMQGKLVTQDIVGKIISELNIPEWEKSGLYKLTPATYIGLAAELPERLL
ncbi:MAG: adenylosuccinate lyase [bacterium]|nr:adenylosuccinate lyase [bacterium]